MINHDHFTIHYDITIVKKLFYNEYNELLDDYLANAGLISQSIDNINHTCQVGETITRCWGFPSYSLFSNMNVG